MMNRSNPMRFLKNVVMLSRRRRIAKSETLNIRHLERGFCDLGLCHIPKDPTEKGNR